MLTGALAARGVAPPSAPPAPVRPSRPRPPLPPPASAPRPLHPPTLCLRSTTSTAAANPRFKALLALVAASPELAPKLKEAQAEAEARDNTLDLMDV